MSIRRSNSVFDKIELRGKWWVPTQPEMVIDGILTGSESGGFRLTLSGNFGNEDFPKTQAERWQQIFSDTYYQSYKVIHGHTIEGDVTLYDASQVLAHYNSRNLPQFAYRINTVLKGTYFNDAYDIKFDQFSVKFSVLNDWIDPRVFNLGFENGPNYDVKFSFPPKRKIYESEGFDIELGFAVTPPALGTVQNNFVVEWEPYFSVKAKNREFSVEDEDENNLFNIAYSLNHFLSFITRTSSFFFDTTGSSDKLLEPPLSNGKQYHTPVRVLREQPVNVVEYDSRNIFFAWSDFESDPDLYFRKWFVNYRQLFVPLHLLLDSQSRKTSYSPERFLNMMMAVEGIHRSKFPQLSEEGTDHKEKKQAIFASIPVEYRNWLEDRLKYSHEPSLRRRLVDLSQKKFKDAFTWLVGGEGNSDQRRDWCAKVTGAMTDSRNRLAHSLPEVGKNPGLRYLYFTKIAELIATMWLLYEIGLSEEVIQSRIMNNDSTIRERDHIVKFLNDELT